MRALPIRLAPSGNFEIQNPSGRWIELPADEHLIFRLTTILSAESPTIGLRGNPTAEMILKGWDLKGVKSYDTSGNFKGSLDELLS